MGWIYAVTALDNQDTWIGSTTKPLETTVARMKEDLAAGNGPVALRAAYKRCGIERLRFIPLKQFANPQLSGKLGEALRLAGGSVQPLDEPEPAAEPAADPEPVRRADVRLARSTISYRLNKGLEGAALTAPPHGNKKRYLVRGEWRTVAELAQRYGQSEASIRTRLHRGLSGEDLIVLRHPSGRVRSRPE